MRQTKITFEASKSEAKSLLAEALRKMFDPLFKEAGINVTEFKAEIKNAGK